MSATSPINRTLLTLLDNQVGKGRSRFQVGPVNPGQGFDPGWDLAIGPNQSGKFVDDLGATADHDANFDDLVHPDQTSSVPGRTIRDSLAHVMSVVHHSESVNADAMILSVDHQAAFDMV